MTKYAGKSKQLTFRTEEYEVCGMEEGMTEKRCRAGCCPIDRSGAASEAGAITQMGVVGGRSRDF